MQNPRPNFFVVGSPKCGTTSLYAWLADHPQVYFPSLKEPHFFALLRPDRTIEKLSEYLSLYAKATPEQIIRGDGSTTYLHTPGAIECVHGFAPDGHIVVIVRNPIDLVRSLHAYKVSRQQEDVTDFEKAWRLNDERQQGRKMPNVPGLIDPFQVAYAEMGLIGKYIERVYQLFPRDRVHVIVFDDMVADPKKVYEDLLAFLGVRQDNRTDFTPRNVTSQSGSGLVYKVAALVPKPLKSMLRKTGFGSSKVAEIGAPKKEVKASKPPVSDAFLNELRGYYKDDVQKLSTLLGRDLSHWLEARKPSESGARVAK